jgi:hypothetical protein
MSDMITYSEPKTTPELEAHYQTLADYCSPEAEAFVIETQEQAQTAADLLNDIKDRLQKLRAAEEYMTQDFVKGIDKIRALMRPAFEAANRATALWKRKLIDSKQRRELAAANAAREVQAAIARGDQKAAQAAVIRIQPVEKAQGVTMRKIWKFEVTDPQAVPRAYLTPNEGLIRADMQASVKAGKDPEIPGVRFWQETSLATTG